MNNTSDQKCSQFAQALTSGDVGDVYGALVGIQKHNCITLLDEVKDLIDHPEPDIRQATARTLAKLDPGEEYKTLVEDVWQNDESDLVRSNALSAWALSYFENGSEGASTVVRTCYSLLKDRDAGRYTREAAYSAILWSSGYLGQLPREDRFGVNTDISSNVDENIDWGLVNSVTKNFLG